MSVGTKSIVFGGHCFFIHPFFVAAAWRRLYGFPWDLRLWCAFFLHDLGYAGKPNMDGPEGEDHVLWAGLVMARWFGARWGTFCVFHSRFYARKHNRPVSRLCYADKLAVALEPWWLYLPRVRLSGEIREYRALALARNAAGEGKYSTMNLALGTDREWFRSVTDYLVRWVAEHRDGRPDTWTPHNGKVTA